MDRVDYQTVIIQDIVNFEKRKELNLRPWYQRRIGGLVDRARGATR